MQATVLVVTWVVPSWLKPWKPSKAPLNISVFPPSSVMDEEEDEDEDEDEKVTGEAVAEVKAVPGSLEMVAGDVIEPSLSMTK